MPSYTFALLHRLLLRVRRTRTNIDLQDELQTHLDMAAQDNCDSGMSAEEAHRRARLKLGSTLAVAERVTDAEFMTIAEAFWHDLIRGCRSVKKTPLFSTLAILTLALGIGANTAIFSLLYGLFLRSLPVHHPNELATIFISAERSNDEFQSQIPFRLLEPYRVRQHSLTDLSLWDSESVSMTDGRGSLRLYNATLLSGNAFQVLDLKLHLGRPILPFDDTRGGPSGGWPVVLGYNLWRGRFAADPNILGKRLELSGASAIVVGVAPRGFTGVFPGMEMDLYLPLNFVAVIAGRQFDLYDSSHFVWFSAIGRLRPGVTLQAANHEAALLRKDLFRIVIPPELQNLPEIQKAKFRLRSARSGLHPEFYGQYSKPLVILQGLVIVVLVLCCVNVGGLMMARVYVRQREFAVRSAIGAGRLRLARQYITESLVIATAGAILGGITAWFVSPVLLSFLRDPTMFEPVSVHPDSMVFWITALSAILTTLFFGTFPALRASRSDPGLLLHSRSFGDRGGQRAVRAFIPVQVALSLVLVALATLLSHSLTLIRGQHRGFDVDHVTIQTPPFHRLPEKGNAKLDLYQRMLDRIQQMPGIRSAAITWFTPMSGQQLAANFTPVGATVKPSRSRSLAYNVVGPGYFRTMETRILAGREFSRLERQLNVCVLNHAAALDLFPQQGAIGRYVRNERADGLQTSTQCRVTGIVEDAKFASLREPAPRTIYYPIAPQDGGETTNFVFLINANTKREAMAAYAKAVSEIAPTIPLVLFVTLREQMDASLGSQRLITTLGNFFAAVALFLSAIGLYGLLSSSIAQRTGEIGLRMALGARRGKVVRLILSEAVTLLTSGIVVGVAGLFLSLRFVDEMLFGVSGFDPAILLYSLGLLVAVTLTAASAPAVRAASLDPMRALRVN